MTNYSITQLPEAERPRERLLQLGPQAISSLELIAIVLGSGSRGFSVLQISQELIVKFGSLAKIADASIEELKSIKGLGLKKAIQLKAALTLGIRASKQISSPIYKITNPLHAYHYIKDEFENEKQERIVVILLNTKGQVLSHHEIAKGSDLEVSITPKQIFYPAIRHQAASIIVVHNHPSGDPSPSKEDIEMTEFLIKTAHYIGISLQDHLIIGFQSYKSLRQDYLKLWNEEI